MKINTYRTEQKKRKIGLFDSRQVTDKTLQVQSLLTYE